MVKKCGYQVVSSISTTNPCAHGLQRKNIAYYVIFSPLSAFNEELSMFAQADTVKEGNRKA